MKILLTVITIFLVLLISTDGLASPALGQKRKDTSGRHLRLGKRSVEHSSSSSSSSSSEEDGSRKTLQFESKGKFLNGLIESNPKKFHRVERNPYDTEDVTQKPKKKHVPVKNDRYVFNHEYPLTGPVYTTVKPARVVSHSYPLQSHELSESGNTLGKLPKFYYDVPMSNQHREPQDTDTAFVIQTSKTTDIDSKYEFQETYVLPYEELEQTHYPIGTRYVSINYYFQDETELLDDRTPVAGTPCGDNYQPDAPSETNVETDYGPIPDGYSASDEWKNQDENAGHTGSLGGFGIHKSVKLGPLSFDFGLGKK